MADAPPADRCHPQPVPLVPLPNRELLGRAHGEAGLAHAARPREGDQADVGAAQQADDLLDFTIASDEGRELGWQRRPERVSAVGRDRADRLAGARVAGRRVGHGRVLRWSRRACRHHRDRVTARQLPAAMNLHAHPCMWQLRCFAHPHPSSIAVALRTR